jgi:hypothetical protein
LFVKYDKIDIFCQLCPIEINKLDFSSLILFSFLFEAHLINCFTISRANRVNNSRQINTAKLIIQQRSCFSRAKIEQNSERLNDGDESFKAKSLELKKKKKYININAYPKII